MCSACNGVGYTGGREQKVTIIPIKIPAGVSDMHKMVERGEGNHSITGGSNGDLIIHFCKISIEHTNCFLGTVLFGEICKRSNITE